MFRNAQHWSNADIVMYGMGIVMAISAICLISVLVYYAPPGFYYAMLGIGSIFGILYSIRAYARRVNR